jgi:hypothetical protein
MYTVLSLDQAEHNIARLTDYGSYYLLSDEETADGFERFGGVLFVIAF